MLFFLAGYETTGSTMAFVFYSLALNQDKQDRLYEEICLAEQEHGVL